MIEFEPTSIGEQNNRNHHCHCCKYKDTIIRRGTTPIHSFDLHDDITGDRLQITYFQGLDKVLELTEQSDNVTIIPRNDGGCVINVDLSQDDTLMFRLTESGLYDVKVQLKICRVGEENRLDVFASDIYYMRVVDTLNDTTFPEVNQTEDNEAPRNDFLNPNDVDVGSHNNPFRL